MIDIYMTDKHMWHSRRSKAERIKEKKKALCDVLKLSINFQKVLKITHIPSHIKTQSITLIYISHYICSIYYLQ